MKALYALLFVSIMMGADELDMLDEIDSDESSFKAQRSPVDARVKLSFLKRNKSDDDKMLYLYLGKQAKNYLYDIRLQADEDQQNINIKELYYKGSFAEVSFYEVGRINIKEGIASGYNPTDYFKGTLSLTLSNDPKERKNNRLGTLAFQETLFLEDVTLKALYSPKVSVGKKTFFGDTKYIGLGLDATNYHDRASFSVEYHGFKDISTSMIWHYNEDDLHFGVNLSEVYGSWIFYLENSLKKAHSDLSKQIDQKHLSQDIYDLYHDKKSYIDQATIGINYTSENNIVTTLEYIFNSQGLDKSDWKDWFSLLEQKPYLAGELGGLRESISQKEEMMSRDAIFLLSRASDIQTNLDVSFLAWINPYDGSSMSQISLEYAYSDDLQTNLSIRNYIGKDESEYGSALDAHELLLELEYYF